MIGRVGTHVSGAWARCAQQRELHGKGLEVTEGSAWHVELSLAVMVPEQREQ